MDVTSAYVRVFLTDGARFCAGLSRGREVACALLFLELRGHHAGNKPDGTVIEDLVNDPVVQAIALPVLVALATTVVIEYVAKPSLDARTTRKLRNRQQFDEVVYGFQKLVLLLSSTLDDATARASAELAAVQKAQAADASQAAQELIASFSQLSTSWVKVHKKHVARAALYVSFVRGLLIAASSDDEPKFDYAKSLAAGVSDFDAYFLAFATLRDSQPPLIKRAFSRWFMRSDYDAAALRALRSAGLTDPSPTQAETSPVATP
jgi:hypothetical protein